MEEILFKLYNGKIRPWNGTCPKGDKYQKAVQQACSIEEALLSQLDETGKELYEQLSHVKLTSDTAENTQIFADAFRLGANIMLACLLEGTES